MNIVVAYRKSSIASKILEAAVGQARVLGATVHLVTSLPGTPATQHPRELEGSRQALDEAVDVVEKEGIGCEGHLLLQGSSSGEDIVQFARDKDALMIVMGVEKKSKVGKFLLGSTAQYVILHAECPVFTVR